MKSISALACLIFALFFSSVIVHAEPLSGGVKANSLSELMGEKGIKMGLEDWPEKWSNEREMPIPSNFPDAKLVSITQPGGGGDYSMLSFIRVDNTYYELTSENLKRIFSPIKSKKDALSYYLFVKKDLSGAWGNSIVFILKEGDYEDPNVILHGGRGYGDKLNRRTTSIAGVDDGYLVTFIAFNYIARVEFFEAIAKVKFDGTIDEVSRKILVDIGPGAFF